MEQPQILINLSNLNIGGAYQRAVSFIKNWSDYSVDRALLVCRADMIEDILKMTSLSKLEVVEVTYSPADIMYGWRTRVILNKIVAEYNVKVAFSFVGPAYWRPKCYHIVGFGVPHIVYKDLPYVKALSVKSKLRFAIKRFVTRVEADHWIVQTKDVQSRLTTQLKVELDKVSIVTNGPGRQFDNLERKRRTAHEFRLITPTTYRPSKNLEIISQIAPLLEKEKVMFYVTLDEISYQLLFRENKNVINLNKISPVDLPKVYSEVDALFLPSYLECFSASYVEAMLVGIPIIASDLPFARTVCEDAAIYFDCDNQKDAFMSIINLKNNQTKIEEIVTKGFKKLESFDTSYEQYKKYLKIIKNV